MNNIPEIIKNVFYKNLYIMTLVSLIYYMKYKVLDTRFIKIMITYIIFVIILEVIDNRKSKENFWFKKNNAEKECGENCELEGDTCICEQRPKRETLSSDIVERQELLKQREIELEKEKEKRRKDDIEDDEDDVKDDHCADDDDECESGCCDDDDRKYDNGGDNDRSDNSEDDREKDDEKEDAKEGESSVLIASAAKSNASTNVVEEDALATSTTSAVTSSASVSLAIIAFTSVFDNFVLIVFSVLAAFDANGTNTSSPG